jgi:hypothetical protein
LSVRTGQTERARAVTHRPSTATRRGYAALVAIALLAVLMATAWGSYVVDGGLTSDDWAYAAFEHQYGYLEATAVAHNIMGSKPLLALLLPLPPALFGAHVGPQIALGLALGVLLAGAFYLALRHLTFRAYEAGLIAALLVLFPWSDSMRLWLTGSLNQVSVTLYLLGLVLALRGLATRGNRGYLLHLAAVSLYAAAILAYDAVAVLALITGAIYLLFAARRRALARWAVDIIVVAAADAYDLHGKTKTFNPLHVTSLHAQLDNAAGMASGAATLVLDAIVPVKVSHRLIAIGLVVMLAAAAIIARRRSAVELRRWLAVAAIATVGIAACYATFVPAALYGPRQPNLYNRVNLVAALGIVVLVYALLRIAAALVLYASSDGRRPVALATVAAVAVGAGYWPRIQEDKRLWAQAAAEQRTVLAAIQRAVPNPQPHDRLFVFGARAQVASRLPVFFDSWDLWLAVERSYGDATLSAYPVFTGAYLYCDDQVLWPIRLPTPSPNSWTPPSGEGQTVESAYGHFWFVDAKHATARRIDDPNTCRAALKTFTPGPYQ